MRFTETTALCRMMLAFMFLACLGSSALAQVAALPVPPECSSSKTLTLPRANHPEKFKAYGKVDLYCGSSSKAFVKGATLCNSDYTESARKTATIAVSSKTKSGKVVSCKDGADLKFVSE